MAPSNTHPHLHQAIASIKEVCTRIIKPRDHQPVSNPEVESTKEDASHLRAQTTMLRVDVEQSYTTSRPQPRVSPMRYASYAHYEGHIRREAKFRYMAMKL
ncbi:hypothetical protein KCU90_g27, partial [Aureobasidium melanogenum]